MKLTEDMRKELAESYTDYGLTILNSMLEINRKTLDNSDKSSEIGIYLLWRISVLEDMKEVLEEANNNH